MAKRRRRIVIATDFSSGSTAAANVVDTLVPTDGGLQVHLVHVVEPVAFAPPPPLWVDYDRARVEDARAHLERAENRLRARLGSSAKIRTYVLTGTPQVEICRLADNVAADLIIVGTHGRTGVRHAVIGSVAERVVRHAGRPVLSVPLVRPPAKRRRHARRA